MISNDICTRSQKCLKLSTTKIAVFSSLQFCLLFFVWVGKKFEMDFLSREIHLSQKLCSTQWVKIAKFYLLAMLKSGILFSKSNILCKYPLQSWCPFLMNTKWQVEKNTNSMHTHTEKNILKGHISKLQQIKRLLVLLHLYFVGFYCLFGSMRGHFCMNSQNGILMNLIFLDAHLHVGFDEIWFHQTHVSCSSLSWLRRVILDLTSF